jgi:D-glycero-D-manno-heptose 1,7-bisphosphate phosphatase
MTVVITNQSGIGRGRFDEEFVGQVHATLDRILAAGRAHIDAYYFCPHHPEGGRGAVPPGVSLPQAWRRHDRAGLS